MASDDGTAARTTAGSGPARAGHLVDAHQHFWDLAAHEQPFLNLPGNEPLLRNFGLADLRPLAAAAGVTATVVVQTVTEPGETAELLALAAGSDLVAGVVGWVDLAAGDVADALAALRERPDGALLCGIRHPLLMEPDPDYLARPAIRHGLAALSAAGLCFDLVLPPGLLPAATAAARACPGLTFVLDHLGNPDLTAEPTLSWLNALGEFAALPNTAAKLSGVLAAGQDQVRPCYEAALAAFGPGRLMYGSDWPVCTLSAAYPDVLATARALTADLGVAEQAAIFGGTARRIYRLR
ncbi:MAG: amidohydrolase family protein [Actinomycetota bacterium]|nr:amidohydrolase family protein [Actinomycetota bacterium]